MINDNERLLKEKIESLSAAQALDLIECKVFSSRTGCTVRCLVDFPSGGVTIDDCARLNRTVSRMLEETGIIGADFTVEVNSPGIDRPLTTYKDFLRVKGKCICLWLKEPYEAKTYWEGTISEVSSGHVGLMVKERLLSIEMTNIKLGKEKIDL